MERTLAIQLVRSISKLPALSSKRAIEKWLREEIGFDWKYCRCCDKFKPPKFFYEEEKTRCAYCTSLYQTLRYWKNPEKFKEIARKSRASKPSRPFPKEMKWKHLE